MLLSKFTANFDSNNPLNEYPRPQLIRDSYINLNGKWDFAITSNENIPETFDSSIVVPFCVESALSGVCQTVSKDNYLYYRKVINFPKGFKKDKVLLHFDAIDQHSKIYINKTLVCENKNGYLPIVIDIAPYLTKKDNEIIVQVKDELDHTYPYGKQRKLEIARALATNPKLLLLDEPAAGMNPHETEELMETIEFIKVKFNTTILLIEHDMKLVMGICDKISVLNFGQVIAEGTPAEIQANEEVIKAYLGE